MTKQKHKLYQTFLKYPHINGCLVFLDNHFQGVLLKKDLERSLLSDEILISENITKVPYEYLEELIFNDTPNIKMKIPYIDPQGKNFGMMLYDEFVSEFFPEDFATRLSFHEVFEYYEYPLLILNKFKTILYLNKAAGELLSTKVFGLKISEALLAFTIDSQDDRMILKRQDEIWKLFISKSKSPHSLYYFYHFAPFNSL